MRQSKDEYNQQEIEARREAGLKKLLATPPKPHKPKSEAKPTGAKNGPKGR